MIVAPASLRHRSGVAPAAAVLVVLAASCDNLSPKVSGICSHDPGTGPIVIGHFASITGDQASFGASDKNGSRSRSRSATRAAGSTAGPIEVIRLDDASKAAEAGTAVTKIRRAYLGVQ